MLKQLTLTNFRQHQSRSIDFTGGINCLRGAIVKGLLA